MKNKLLSALAAGILCSSTSYGQMLYGVTDANAIFTMSNPATPSSINGPYAVSGIASGQALIGIHSRPSNGGWYAIGYDSVAQMAELYTITNSGTTFSATPVSGTLMSMNLGTTNNASFSFVGTTENQIRVIGRNGNNYLMNADYGTVTTTGASGLSYAGGDLYSAASNQLTATAYTNNFYGADATDEVGYDAVNNVLVNMDAGSYANSFNNASNTMHSIGVTTGVIFNTTGSMGMDTWYDTVTHTNTVYMSGNTLLSGAHLYKYNMSGAGGTMTDLGAIGSGSLNVRGIGFQAVRDSSSAITGRLMTGLSLNMRNLVYFDSKVPGHIRKVVSLHGMTSGQSMIGIDYSSTGTLYGLGYNSGSHTYQLYTIDSATGNVSAVNSTAGTLNLGTDDGSGNYVNAGFRFIPTATNRIRVIGNSGTVNSQLDATTGAVVETDTAMSYVTGDAGFGTTANITSVAYTGYQGDATTQMFGFDANTGNMVTFDAVNSSTGFGNGSSGYASTGLNLNTTLSLLAHTSGYNNSSMNISYDQSAHANVGYMASNYMGDSAASQQNYSILYDMTDMLTAYSKGTSTAPVTNGGIGQGVPVKDIAMRRSYSPEAVYNVANAANNTLLVYPNPTANYARVILPAVSTGVVYVDVIDLNGRIERSYQYAAGSYQVDVDMSPLATGLYSVRVSGNGVGYYNLKVIKE